MAKEKTSILSKTWVPAPEEEHARLKAFYNLQGVRAQLQKAYPTAEWGRRQIDEGLNTGSYRADLLADMRAFLKLHEQEFAQFLQK